MPIHTFSAFTFHAQTFTPIRLSGSAGGAPGPTTLNRPASVNVTFPRWLEYRQLRGQTSSLGYAESGSVATGIGTYKQVFSSAYWRLPESDDESDTTYRAPLQALTNQIGQDYFSWLSNQYTLVFQGIKDWEPTGFDDCVVWEIGCPDESANGEDCVIASRTGHDVYDAPQARPATLVGAGRVIGRAIVDPPLTGRLTFAVEIAADRPLENLIRIRARRARHDDCSILA